MAIALRNRMRRQKLAPELAEEIAPKNILMIGPTGVGKTEIARRLARLAQSPFLKVEASKFTEVGYVGRDVESMVRDLVELGVDMVRDERLEEVRAKAAQNAEERLLDILLPPPRPIAPDEEPAPRDAAAADARAVPRAAARRPARQRASSKSTCARNRFRPSRSSPGRRSKRWTSTSRTCCRGCSRARRKKRKLKVPEALEYLVAGRRAEADRHGQRGAHRGRARRAGRHHLLDEIDKIAGREGSHGPDVSREGVQRDILPIVEGTTVNTKYGMVRTDHILFIAAGAFHVRSRRT